MNFKPLLPIVVAVAAIALFAYSVSAREILTSPLQQDEVSGVVFEDLNGNRLQDDDEPGIAGVLVSNGVDIAETDDDGLYRLPVLEKMVVFVIKPADYMVPVDDNNVPEFYYIHYPDGSPEYIQEFRGLEPTGDLPESVDFPLYAIEASPKFTQLALGDTQPRNHAELQYLRDGAISDIVQNQAFGAEVAIALGDLMFDNLTLYDRYKSLMGLSGIPTYYLPGNHDMDVDALDDEHHLDTYISHFGPTYYAFNHGEVHFIVLDNVLWLGATEDLSTGNYTGSINKAQMEWMATYLEYISEDKLVVLAMHIPLVSWIDRDNDKHMTDNRAELYALFEGRKVLAMAGHTHTSEVHLPGDELEQWEGEMPFTQIIAGATSGSWFSGEKDDFGRPLSYQREGAPKGYFIVDYAGTEFQPRYKGVSFPAEKQMHLSFLSRQSSELPAGIITVDELNHTRVVVNVWAGSTQSEVRCAYDNGAEFTGTRSTTTRDPFALSRQEGLSDWMHTNGSWHIWTCPLASDLDAGAHTLTVTVNDSFGQTFTESMVFEVWSINK